MWFAIIGALGAVSFCGILYISFRAANFDAVKRAAGGRRWLGRLIYFAAVSAIFAALLFTLNMWNALVITVHFVLFWAVGDLVALIVRCFITRRRRRRYYVKRKVLPSCRYGYRRNAETGNYNSAQKI